MSAARPTTRPAAGLAAADRLRSRRPARPPTGSVTDDRRWQTTTTDTNDRYKSGPYTMCRRASNQTTLVRDAPASRRLRNVSGRRHIALGVSGSRWVMLIDLVRHSFTSSPVWRRSQFTGLRDRSGARKHGEKELTFVLGNSATLRRIVTRPPTHSFAVRRLSSSVVVCPSSVVYRGL